MSDLNQAGEQLLVTMHDEAAFVHVIGRASFKISSSLKQFGIAAVESDCRHIVLDMVDCIGMDSTFMGVLAGLAFRLQQRNEGDILMVNLSERTRGLLATLGLDQVIRPYMKGATPPEFADVLAVSTDLNALEATPESRREIAETMLDAHENLVGLSPQNLPKFKDVLTYLREDIRKEAGLDSASSSG